jgi:signal transduction histidine kinase
MDARKGGQSLEELQQRVAAVTAHHQRLCTALASAAHELNTPVSIISGYIDLLLLGTLGPLKQKNVLQDMLASTARLKRVIQDFLLISTFEASPFAAPLRLEEGDVNSCVGEICSFWRNRFEQAGIVLYCRTNSSIAPFVFDFHKVQHVISNLLDNALRFSRKDGSVWVNVEPIFWERRSHSAATSKERRKSSILRPNAVRISVADTGAGIAPEFQQLIFEEFYKTESGGDGVGLGLSIGRWIVEAHGGRIWVDSQPGSGSTFYFVLPFQPAQTRALKSFSGGAE